MFTDLFFFDGLVSFDLAVSAALAFFVGMAGVMVYSTIKSWGGKRDYRADEAVIEAIVLEYTRRLRDYDRVIAELRTKVDIIEIRAPTLQPSSYNPTSQQLAQLMPQSHQVQPHVAHVSGPAAITQHAATTSGPRVEGQNGTTDYILKLLSERPRTSREVQHAIGRTREHTARVMKKLHDSGLVSRDVTVKPFRYSITDVGRGRLREKVEAASELPAV